MKANEWDMENVCIPAEYISSVQTCMTRNDLLNDLRAQISPAERAALRDDTVQNISRYNRATLLRILECEASDDGRLDAGRVEALHAALGEYLNRYMQDTPEAHKWIILPCLFLAFVAMEPMHPQAIVGWEKTEGGYLCPSREEGGICQWCVCR